MATRALRAVAGNRPLQVAMYDAPLLRLTVREVLEASSFDIAHVQLARLGPVVGQLSPLPCVLDMIDALSLNMARRGALDRGPLRWIAGVEAGRLADYEREVCAQVRTAIVSTAHDRAAIGDLSNLHVVSNGVDLQQFPFVTPQHRAKELVFVGNLGYFPNVDAICWFVRNVMPRLAKHFPEVVLNLVGARPALRLRRLASCLPHVRMVGPVPSVHPHITERRWR